MTIKGRLMFIDENFTVCGFRSKFSVQKVAKFARFSGLGVRGLKKVQFVITVPERQGQTNGRTDRRTCDITALDVEVRTIDT